MSRGLGVFQRRVVALLSADLQTVEEGLSAQELRLALAGVDKTNRSRSIRSLLLRGAVEQVTDPETGASALRLSFPWRLAAYWRLNPPDYYEDRDV